MVSDSVKLTHISALLELHRIFAFKLFDMIFSLWVMSLLHHCKCNLMSHISNECLALMDGEQCPCSVQNVQLKNYFNEKSLDLA